jgi:cytochrome c oxidase subunit 2
LVLIRTTIAAAILLVMALMPGPASANDLTAGRARFSICGACHGLQGQGNRELGAPRIAALPSWYVSRQLQSFASGSRGGPESDRTSQQMAPFARNLSSADIADLSAYVESLPGPASMTADSGNAAPGSTGQAAFQQCAACHGAAAEGSEALGAPPLHGLNAWYLGKQLGDFKSGVRGYDATDTFAATMRMIAQSIDTKETADAIAAYLHLTD